MSVTLETTDGRSLRVNAWNWGVLHHMVTAAGVLPPAVWESARFGGGGVDGEQARAVADFLTRELLPRLAPGERMFYDGSVTAVADDGTFYRSEDELWKNYSLHRGVLEQIIALFAAAADGVSFR